MLQQITVVARHFDDEAARAEREAVNREVDEPPGMGHPRVRERREIGVIDEDIFWCDACWKLHQQAFVAHPHVQRVVGFAAL